MIIITSTNFKNFNLNNNVEVFVSIKSATLW